MTMNFFRLRPLRTLMLASVIIPLALSACSFFSNRTEEAIVRIQADTVNGQGVIADATGYVITSGHAVKGSQSLSIELKSGSRYEAKILCLNQAKDVAVLKMQGKIPTLQALTLGDSDFAQQYDDISVVGYMPDSKNLVTLKGAITSFPKSEDAGYLQTNAALEPGLAGSVVLNKAGEVIGIVSWNFGQAGREGWSLTSNEIKSILIQAQEAEAVPLAITSVEITSISNTSAVISWKTNRPASSQVEYGLQIAYGSQTAADTTSLAAHGVVIENLQPKTSYHFRVKSTDSCGNEVVSADQTLTTMLSAAQSGKLAISNVNVYNITSNAASIKWITNKPAGTVVSYGNNKADKPDNETDRTPVYEHNVRLNGLDPETRYYVTVKSDTEYGETAQLDVDPFSTLTASIVCCHVNCRLPEFSFKTVQGTDFTMANISGKKVFMIFVKTSCPTCMQQAIYLNDIYQTWPKGSDVMLVAVASNEKPADVTEWMRKYGLNIPVYIDPNSDLANICKLKTIPSAFFLDTGGVIKNFHSGGYSSKRDMELALQQFQQ
jgi:S1-C subfamily serine protease/peroxiredoxin